MRTVTLNAVLQRLNRKLAHDDLGVRRCRYGSRSYVNLGDYYIISLRNNTLNAPDIDLLAWARKYGCIRADEQVVD